MSAVTPARGRLPRAIAVALLLALAAIATLGIARRREVEGRYRLRQALRARPEAPSAAIFRAVELLGRDDPRVVAALDVRPGMIALAATPCATVAGDEVGPIVFDLVNVSGRPIVLVGAQARAFHVVYEVGAESISYSFDDPTGSETAFAVQPGERFQATMPRTPFFRPPEAKGARPVAVQVFLYVSNPTLLAAGGQRMASAALEARVPIAPPAAEAGE